MNKGTLITNIDSHILSFLKNKKKDAIQLDSHLEPFIDILIEYLDLGGKHIRSSLFYKAYMTGKKTENFKEMEKVAGVFELFQAFALIHDDIIDKESYRRGRQTIHEKYGIPTAILLGNMALMYSDEILLSQLEDNDFINKKLIIKLFQQYKQEVMLGQYLDVQHTGSIKTIMYLKTSQYTFIKPVIMGLLFAEGEYEDIPFWESNLQKLGEAFQLKDDYKNIFSTSDTQGKDRMSDIKEGKQTFMVGLFFERAKGKELELFKNIFSKTELDEKEKKWIIDIMTKLDIKKDIEKRINSLCSEVLHAVSSIRKNELTDYIGDIIASIKI